MPAMSSAGSTSQPSASTALDPKKAKELAELEAFLVGERWRHVLWHGVLGWGLLCAFLELAWTWWRSDQGLASVFLESWPGLLLWPLAGVAFGWAGWEQASQRRNRLQWEAGAAEAHSE